MTSELKYEIMKEIEQHVDIFKRISYVQWRIRCPFCGDSQKNLQDTHMYIKCDYDNPGEPIKYYCFLANCNAHGYVDKYFMDKLGIHSNVVDQISNQRYSKITAFKETNIEIITGEPILDSPQVRYIEERLGNGFTKSDYDRFKIIWDLSTVTQYISNQSVLNTMPSNNESISFLSDDKSTLLTRAFIEDANWRKINIITSGNRLFYTIKSMFNLFTQETITVNIAEGIFDILSVYKNFNTGENSAYIATLGSDYIGAVNYAIIKGLVGYNVELRIYIDAEINKDKLKTQLKKYRYYFGKIRIFKNIRSKDVGVLISNIELVEY